MGSYDEAFGSIGFRRGPAIRGDVAFMAADSETSLVAGRLNWAMPNTLASFGGEIGSKSTIVAESALHSDHIASLNQRSSRRGTAGGQSSSAIEG